MIENISASGINTWFECKRKWREIYVKGNRDAESGDAANMGTAIHKTLERAWMPGYGLNVDPKVQYVCSEWPRQSVNLKQEQVEEGSLILAKWLGSIMNKDESRLAYHDPDIVITATELDGLVPLAHGGNFRFIIDRVDYNRRTFEFAVWDYKSGAFQIDEEDYENNPQVKGYPMAIMVILSWAMAAPKQSYADVFNSGNAGLLDEHIDHRRRHVGDAGSGFTTSNIDYMRDENKVRRFRYRQLFEFYHRISNLHVEMNRRVESDDLPPEPGPGCRFCHISHSCPAVNPTSVQIGGTTAELVTEYRRLTAIKGNITREYDKVRRLLQTDMDRNGLDTLSEPGYEIGQRKRTYSYVDVKALTEYIDLRTLVENATITPKKFREIASQENLPPEAVDAILKSGTGYFLGGKNTSA